MTTTRLRTLWQVRAAAIRIQLAARRAKLERMTTEELVLRVDTLDNGRK